MSFFHFDATTAASASQGIVHLENINVSAAGNPWSAYGQLQFYGDGEAWSDETGFETFLFNWIEPATGAILPGDTPYQLMRSGTVGDEPSGPSDGVWTELITAQGLGLPNTTNGGTGYANGQVVTVVGGDLGTGGFPAQFVTQNVSGGIVPTALGLTTAGGSVGKYFTAPNDAHGTTVVSYTGGTGTGLQSYAQFNPAVSWSVGASYPGREFCTFTLSIRKGTGPVLATCSVSLEADAG